MKTALLSFAACLALSTTASAATYYVSTAGADSNPGSQAQPWRTIQHAVDAVAPGDTIVVQAGRYAGCRIGKSGATGAPCTLRAETPGTVVIDSLSPANRHQSLIEIENFEATVRYWTLDGLEVASAQRYGIDLRDTDFITVQNCKAHNSRLTGIFLAFSYHPLIQNNECYSNGEHGIYQSNSGDFPAIRGNRLHHNFAAGLHMNGDRNFTPGDGIISFAIVEKNVIWENGTGGGSGINCDGVSDSIIRNNLLYNNHASGISLYAIDASEGSSRNRVYNNTIVMPDNGRWCVNIPASSEGQPDPAGNVLRNNILYTSHTFRGSVSVYGAATSGFSSDYNVVVNRFSTDGGDTNRSLASWRALGYDQHSIVATPDQLFTNVAGDDYSLKSGSPAIDSGVSLLGDVPDDISGASRPQGGSCDIGCYERPAVTPPSPVDYFCIFALIEVGKLIEGDHESLHASDDSYLRLKAAEVDGAFGDVVTCVFDTGLAGVSNLSVTVTARAKAAPVRQQISLFNFSNGDWEPIDDRAIETRKEITTTVSSSNPRSYLSPAGEIRVRIQTGDVIGGRWKHLINLVRITAAP